MSARLEAALAELAAAIHDELAAGAMPTRQPDRLLNAGEACQRLGGIARSTLYELAVPSLKVGRRRFWPESYISAYLAQNQSGK